ncbi:MAG: hypothetical protein GYB67_11775 [Chloroflexi bacterium]|nr:hypothetical protein [Chloroflexota bacterium]
MTPARSPALHLVWLRLSLFVWLLTATATCLLTQAVATRSDQVAFASDRSGNWDIYLLDLAKGITHNLTAHPADDRAPAWSPDGRRLAFLSYRQTNAFADIYILDMRTGTLQRITTGQHNDYRRVVWSPDGQDFVHTPGYGAIHIMDINAQADRPLSYGFGPSWSPDGTYIVYYANQRGDLNSDIYALSVDGRELVNFTAHGANDWSPAWSPDGAHIAFVSNRGGNADIYTLSTICLTADQPCADSTRRLTDHPRTDTSPAWSPDGQRLAFVAAQADGSSIYMIDTTADHISEPQRLVGGPGENRAPAWRPQR